MDFKTAHFLPKVVPIFDMTGRTGKKERKFGAFW
jgi:hypothetical protein